MAIQRQKYRCFHLQSLQNEKQAMVMAALNFYLSTPDATVGGETLKTLRGFFDAINRRRRYN